ncbi:MAG: VaFE repeat-containing surface-anchored protein [Coriobacteriales bacterium]
MALAAIAIAVLLCLGLLPSWTSSAYADTTYHAYARGIQRLVMGYVDGNGQSHTWNESVRAVDEDADGVNISTVAYCADLWTSPPPTGTVRRGDLRELYSQDKIDKMALVNVFVDQHSDIFYDDTYDESFRLFFRQMAYWKIQNMDNGKLRDTFLEDSERFGMTKAEVDALYDQVLAFINDPTNRARYVGHGYAYFGPAGTQNLMKVWYERKPTVEITKTAAGGQLLPGQSLSGAEYTVYRNENLTGKVETVSVGANGIGKGSACYDSGTYFVKEMKAPRNFTLDETVYKLVVKTGKTTATVKLQVQDFPQGKLSIRKTSAVPATTDGNPCYSFEGATFDIYADSELTNKVSTITVNKDGYGESDYLEASSGKTSGKRYYIREQQGSRGSNYAWNDTVYEANAMPGRIVAVGPGGKIDNVPQVDMIGVFLNKIDIETGAPVAQGDATLAGARFKVEYFANESGDTTTAPARTWTFTTDEQGRLDLQNADPEGDAPFRSHDGQTNVFPVGTYRIAEVAPPTGYLLPSVDRHGDNDGPWTVRVTGDGSVMGEQIATFNGGDEAVVQREQVIRGDLELIKVAEDGMQRLAGQPFILKSNTTGEMHVVVTDENGCISTASDWNSHEATTNANDPLGANGGRFDGTSNGAVAIAEDGSWYVADESKLDASSGVWFGLDSAGNWTERASDDEGALPYDGAYELIELPCAANEGLKTVDIHNIAVRRDGRVVDMGTIDDSRGPRIRTQAHDGATMTHVGSLSQECTLVDTVSYEGLDADQEYVLKARLMNAETGEPVTEGGEGVEGSATFTPQSSFGTVEVPISLDASELQGASTVIFESLVEASSGKEIASHADLEDEGQSIEFPPEVKTSAVDAADGDRNISPSGTQSIVDTVTYRGLKAGQEYTIRGTLVDKETGATLLAPDATAITAEVAFTPEEPDGTIDVVFEFGASMLAGKTTVVFEELLLEERSVCSHADLDDGAQTLRFPNIGTVATDKEDGDDFINPTAGAVVVDMVAYGGLEPGAAYRMEATLMDATSGEPVELGGEPVKALLDFTPESPSGNLEVELPVDASDLAGKRLVVFERLMTTGDGEKTIASHENLDDEGQSVSVPALGTKALDKADGNKTIASVAEATIIDTVSYEGLLPGRSYVVEGILMDKSTGKALVIDGRRVTATQTFVPDAPAGSVDMEFAFDGSGLAPRKEIVAFETMFHDGKQVATHCDLKDERQMVTVESRPLVKAPNPTQGTRSGYVPKTGDDMKSMMILFAVFGIIGGVAVVFGLHQKGSSPRSRE